MSILAMTVATAVAKDFYSWSNAEGNRGLVKMDSESFNPELVFSSDVEASAAECGPGGLYLISSGQLLRYDISTGAVATVGEVSADVKDLAYNHSDRKMYAVVSNDSYGELRTIDLTTGALEKVMDFSASTSTYKVINISFTSTGSMYAVIDNTRYGLTSYYMASITVDEAGTVGTVGRTTSLDYVSEIYFGVDPADDTLYRVAKNYKGAILGKFSDGFMDPFDAIGDPSPDFSLVGLYTGYEEPELGGGGIEYGDGTDAWTWSNKDGNKGLVKMDLATFEPQLMFTSDITATTATYGPDGFYVITSDLDLMRFNLLTGASETICKVPVTVQDLAFNPADQKMYAVVSNDSYGELDEINLTDGTLTKSLDFSYRYTGAYKVVKIAFKSDGSMYGLLDYTSYGVTSYTVLEIGADGTCTSLFRPSYLEGIYLDVDPRDDMLYMVASNYKGAQLLKYNADAFEYYDVVGTPSADYDFVGLYTGYRKLTAETVSYPLPYSCGFVSAAEFSAWSSDGWTLGEGSVSTDGSTLLVSPALRVDADCKVEIVVETTGESAYEVFVSTTADMQGEAAATFAAEGKNSVVVDAAAGQLYVGIKNIGASLTVNSVSVSRYTKASLSGFVKCGDAAVSGIEISLDGELAAVSAADGAYWIEDVPAGEHTLTAYGKYYEPYSAIVTLNELQDLAYDIILTQRDINTAVFSVTSGGSPLEGAQIKIETPFEQVAFTDADGKAELEDITAGHYWVTVSKNGYSQSRFDCTVEGQTTIPAAELHRTAGEVLKAEAKAEGYDVTLTWTPAIDLQTVVYDNGEVYVNENGYPQAVGFSDTYGENIMGTVFRQPGTIYYMDWYSVPGYERAETANVLVIALDDDGMPTGEVLGAKEGVKIQEGWNHVEFDTPIEAPKGFLLGMTSTGYIALGYDNGDDTMPQRPNVSSYSNIYSSASSYRFFDEYSTVPGRRLMIRPTLANIEPEGTTLASTPKYDVYRADTRTNENNHPGDIVASDVTGHSCTDTPTAFGEYLYTVVPKYDDGVTGAGATSNPVDVDMSVTVSVDVTTNIGVEAAEGAVIKLTNTITSQEYTGAVHEGKASIADVRKGNYTIDMRQRGLDRYTSDLEIWLTGDAFGTQISTNQALDMPSHIDIIPDADGNAAELVWDRQPNLFDNFDGEDHADWAINSRGDCGWEAVDGDGFNTWTFANYYFPGEGSPMGTLIVNSSKLVGRSSDYPYYYGRPLSYSGARSMALVAAYPEVDAEGYMTPRNSDDYLLSPELDFYKDFTLKFMARSQMPDESGLVEQMRVGYSTDSTDPADFEWLTELEDVPVSVSEDDGEYWSEYSFTLPAEAKRVAINSQSRNIFMLLVDDLSIGTETQVSGNPYKPLRVESYKLDIDGEHIGSFTGHSYDVSTLKNGYHTASVKAVYATGESEALSIDFEINERSGIGSAVDVKGSVSVCDGVLSVTGFDETRVYTIGGVTIETINGDGSVKLASGIYIVVADGVARKVTVK